jgi:uncharacterized protein (TIGR02611 family)
VDRLRQLLGFIVHSTRRLAVLVIGGAVVAAGLVMMVAPGPGLIVIIAGLAILATEFTWAEILLVRAKKQALKAKDAAVRRGAGFLRRRRNVTVEVTELVEIDDRAEVVGAVEVVEAVDAVEVVEPVD